MLLVCAEYTICDVSGKGGAFQSQHTQRKSSESRRILFSRVGFYMLGAEIEGGRGL